MLAAFRPPDLLHKYYFFLFGIYTVAKYIFSMWSNIENVCTLVCVFVLAV